MTFITIQNKKIQLVLPISIIIFISLLICNDLTDGKTFLYSFIAFGICMILVLWLLIISVYSINSDMYYDKKKIFISIIFISVNWLMYLYINYACDSIKIWDYACYYRIALAMRDQFSSGYGSALKWVLATIYNDEYNSFLLLFTIFPFEITSRTIECFINAYYVVYIIPTLLIWMSIGNRILKKCGKDKDLVSYCVICVAVAFFPLLHATATKGMPDVGGVLFAGLLILIFWEYDFIKFDLKRLMIGMVVSICLFLFRRWYTFWLIAFYTTYFTGCIVFGFLNKKSYIINIINNIVWYCMAMISSVSLTLFPLIRRILTSDFGNRYSAWNRGGLSYEIINQYNYLGLLAVIIILLGYLFGVYKKQTDAIYGICIGIISVILFTRIQNMGGHHSLLLVPSYLIGIFLLLGNIKINCKYVYKIGLIIIILILNLFGSITESKYFFSTPFFGNMSLKPETRNDMDIISSINLFIEEYCSDEKTIYMILGSGKYNPDVFRNSFLPDKSRDNIILTEHSVDLTHGFPNEFFDASYILTSSPVQQGNYSKEQLVISEMDNALHNGSVVSDKFKLRKRIAGEDITFYIYERIKEVDNLELDYFEFVFDIYNSEYPDLYKDRIELYRK